MKIKKSKQNEGWTFIETLIVMAIVLILTAAVGFSAIKQIDKAKVVTEVYANGERPYSAGCQITHLEDFNEVTGILKDLGFEYGKGNDAWTKGDTIKINIKSPEKE
jgi:hypothetical protein